MSSPSYYNSSSNNVFIEYSRYGGGSDSIEASYQGIIKGIKILYITILYFFIIEFQYIVVSLIDYYFRYIWPWIFKFEYVANHDSTNHTWKELEFLPRIKFTTIGHCTLFVLFFLQLFLYMMHEVPNKIRKGSELKTRE